MVAWSAFAAEAPELAALGQERMAATGLILLGTSRADGSPRISPVEPFIIDGELYLGMMWQSRKALDLLRDPRCVVHTSVADKAGTEGDFKAYGRAVDVQDADVRERYCRTLHDQIGWRPEGDWHLFKLDVTSVGYVRFGEGRQEVRRWKPGGPEAPVEERQA